MSGDEEKSGFAGGNFYRGVGAPVAGERFEVLLECRNLVVERIVSSSKIPSVEYVQEQDEWVLLVGGEAELLVEEKKISLVAGDYLFLPARVPHSVLRVSEGALWLAVHLHQGGEEKSRASG